VARDEQARSQALNAVGSFRNDNRLGSTGNPVYASTELKVVERITRIEADVLRWEATISDPKRRPIQGGLTVGGQPIPESGPESR
jgi:hypothetical protein